MIRIPFRGLLLGFTALLGLVPCPPLHAQFESPKAPYDKIDKAGETDADRDGIADSVEAELLRRFSPFYLFNEGEEYRPSDAIWYIKNSELLDGGDETTSTKIYGIEQLEKKPWLVLEGNSTYDHDRYCSLDSNNNWNCESNLLTNPRQTLYHINVYNGCRQGAPWEEIIRDKNVGLYGHVNYARNNYKPGDPPPDKSDRSTYIVEYWQFYPYNRANIPEDIADHEAEWETVQVLVDAKSLTIKSVFHFVHGDSIRFDLKDSPYHYKEVPIDSPFKAMEYRVDNRYNIDPELRVSPGPKGTTDNNLLRLGYDDSIKAYTHPLVYVEKGTHGMWPSEYWKMCFSVVDWCTNSHAGNGPKYKTNANKRNLGEVDYPLNEVDGAEIILRYNGRWGAYNVQNDNPSGPALHNEYSWASNTIIGNLINRRYDVSIQTGNVDGAGTDADVHIKLFGSQGVTNGNLLDSADNDFEANSYRTYSINRTGELGTIQKVQIWHDNNGKYPEWFFNELWVENVWKDTVLDCQYFPCFSWLTGAANLKTLFPGKKYDIYVKTGNVDGAGTDANVYIQIFGSKGTSRKYLLDLSGDDFEKGYKGFYPFGCADLGTIQKITMSHDNSGDYAEWFLEEVWVNDVDASVSYDFKCSCWLKGNESQNIKTLYPVATTSMMSKSFSERSSW